MSTLLWGRRYADGTDLVILAPRHILSANGSVIEMSVGNLDYNVPGSKLNRGMSVVDTTKITKGTSLTDDEYLKAAVLGWGTELLQALFLVSDDMMDSPITRRGQPC
ncbi:uncharacterized protein ARMOST_21795 [Armillaria ostoyae]|uniref:(2E,6E)-farnesyl diphosphate synthase n=1 Tax=Armillaria ostoyae TaxID=47428 RepID=A0A284SB28_ARMOS|nr:uncharacterized protein ARMOST_21795 [Armillaria ostoyae]